MGVVIDAQLVRHGQQQRVGLGDGFVRLELLDENVRLGGVAPPENGTFVAAEEADLVLALVAAPEIGVRSDRSPLCGSVADFLQLSALGC